MIAIFSVNWKMRMRTVGTDKDSWDAQSITLRVEIMIFPCHNYQSSLLIFCFMLILHFTSDNTSQTLYILCDSLHYFS